MTTQPQGKPVSARRGRGVDTEPVGVIKASATHEVDDPNIHYKFFSELTAPILAELTGGMLERVVDRETGRATVVYPWDNSIVLNFRAYSDFPVEHSRSKLLVNDHILNNPQLYDLDDTVLVTDDLKPGEVTFVWPTSGDRWGVGDVSSWLTIGNGRVTYQRVAPGGNPPELSDVIRLAGIKASGSRPYTPSVL